mgnify:CR=1 FL=1
MHLTGGILRHFRAFPTPEQNPALGVLSTPAHPQVTQAVRRLVESMMKASLKITSQKLCLYQVCFVMILTACGTAPTQTAMPTAFNESPVFIATQTETPLTFFRYIVFAGETCAQIALNFNVSEQAMIDLNNLELSCPIESGQELLVPYPTVSNVPSSTPQPVEIVKVVTTLNFIRNQKNYTVTIATAHFILINRDLYNSLTPPPKLPEKPSDSVFYRAKIKEVSDIDNDGEQEYTVLLNKCADSNCSSFVSYIKIYKYNQEKDEFYVFSEFETEPEEIEAKISY